MPMQQEYDGFGYAQKIENTAARFGCNLSTVGTGTVIVPLRRSRPRTITKQLSGVEYTVNNDASVRIENNRLIV